MGIRTECAQVVDVTVNGDSSTYTQDFSKPVTLTVVDKSQGRVTCPLYQDGLCGGDKPCVINEVDSYTTVIMLPITS